MPDGKHGWPTGGPRRPRLRGVGVPAALVGASMVLILIVVAVSNLIGGGPGIIPRSERASSTDQARVLDKQTQTGQGGRAPSGSPAAGNFQPVSVEAETATLGGSAVPSAQCDGCSGGTDVRFIGVTGDGTGTVTFSGLNVPATGTYHLTIGCVLGDGGHGPFVVSVDGGPPTSVTCPVGSWSSVSPTTVPVTLRAGVPNTVAFGNPTMAAPDLDDITLSQ